MRLTALLLALAVLFTAPLGLAQTAAPANPHAQLRGVDQNAPAEDLPAGTIEAIIVDVTGAPQPNIEVRLGILEQSVAQGEKRSQRTLQADAEGRVRFEGLSVASGVAYRVTVKYAGADYASAPFNLRAEMGQRVVLHVFPVSRRLDESTRIGMRGFIFIAPRDDVFQFEVLFRVFNMGQVTWVPDEPAVMELPLGFKAFRATENMNDTRFAELPGTGAKLTGTFTPGQHDVGFRFQVPKKASDTASFTFGLPPRVAEIRVITEASPKMGLEIDGFEPVQSDIAPQTGARVLVTRKVLKDPSSRLGTFSVVLTGLPTPGPGRWIAVIISLVVAAAGALYAAGFFGKRGSARAESEAERQQARELILAELLELERLHAKGEVGPRAYARHKDQLLDALARIGVPADEKKQKKTKRRAEKGAPEASTA